MVSGPRYLPLRGPFVYFPPLPPAAARNSSTVIPCFSASMISSSVPCSISIATLRLRTRLPPRGGLLVGIFGAATGAGSLANRSRFASAIVFFVGAIISSDSPFNCITSSKPSCSSIKLRNSSLEYSSRLIPDISASVTSLSSCISLGVNSPAFLLPKNRTSSPVNIRTS